MKLGPLQKLVQTLRNLVRDTAAEGGHDAGKLVEELAAKTRPDAKAAAPRVIEATIDEIRPPANKPTPQQRQVAEFADKHPTFSQRFTDELLAQPGSVTGWVANLFKGDGTNTKSGKVHSRVRRTPDIDNHR